MTPNRRCQNVHNFLAWRVLFRQRLKEAQGAGATAARAGGAGEAMRAGLDGGAFQFFGREVPEERGLAVAHLHPEHLVEIAVVELTHPADAEGGAAHEVLDGSGIEAVGEEFEVRIPLAILAEVLGETADGLVGYGEETGEFDAVTAAKFGLVVGFQLVLSGREFGAEGIIDEIEGKMAAVAHGVQLFQGTDALFEYAVATLSIYILLEVTREGGNNFDIVSGKVFGQPAVGLGFDDGQVISVNDVATTGTCGFHEITEMFAQLWGSARQVNGHWTVQPNPVADSAGSFPVHHFRTPRSGLNVAMVAGLVAFAADVDL